MGSAVFDLPKLNALNGLAFATDRDGVIMSVGARNWNAFAARNGAPELQADAVIGRNLFDFISGAQVQAQVKHAMERLAQHRNASWVLSFRCDAPDCMRKMEQRLKPVFSERLCKGFIFHTVERASHKRPPVAMFEFKRLQNLAQTHRNLPVVTMCSWCQRVRGDAANNDTWVEAEAYRAAGGSPNVRLEHGMCLDCLETAAELFLWS